MLTTILGIVAEIWLSNVPSNKASINHPQFENLTLQTARNNEAGHSKF